MRWAWPWMCVVAVGCSSAPPPPKSKPLFVDGVMQKPLTPQQAEQYLQRAAPDFGVCYKRERMNMAKQISDYVFQLVIPPDGTQPEVSVVRESVPGQVALRDCLSEALQRVDFPAHVGSPITIKVPIQGG